MTVALRIDALTGIASLQDTGRVGHEHLGIPTGGFWHTTRAHLANALACNPNGAPAIELLAGALTVTNIADEGTVLAVTGPATCHLTHPGSKTMFNHPTYHAMHLPPGSSATITHTGAGPVYLAAHGLTGRQILGSVGACAFTGITPNPLSARTELGVREHQPVAAFASTAVTRADTQPPTTLPYTPHTAAALTLEVQVARTGRTGAHLHTTTPHEGIRAAARDLPSHPVHPGLFQITPAGILALGVDAGTTGGYPTLGVIHTHALNALSLLTPESTVLLTPDLAARTPQPAPHIIRLAR